MSSEKHKEEENEEESVKVERCLENYRFNEIVVVSEGDDESETILLNDNTDFNEKQIQEKRNQILNHKTENFPKEQKKSKKNKNKLQEFYDPFDSLKDFKADSSRISKEIKEALKNEGNSLNNEMAKLGLKNSKALGNIRSKKIMNIFVEYLETGNLPQEYTDELLTLISD